MESYYIIIQEGQYKHGLLMLKKSDYKKIFSKTEFNPEIFVLDHKNNKLYGSYKIDVNSKKEDNNYYVLKIASGNHRRGIYYTIKKQNGVVIKISFDEYIKLKRKLDALNNQMPQTFFAYSIKNNTFKYQIVETSKSLYVAEYEKEFDKNAFESINNEYKKLISIATNEDSSQYNIIGNALMNMLIPEDNIRDFLFSKPRIIYLSNALSKSKINIPFEILSCGKKFLSQSSIFSYTHAKNITPMDKGKKDKIKLAIILIPNIDLTHAEREVHALLNFASDYVEIDTFRKNINYLELINILEQYDAVHIITHGKNSGVMLSEKYLIKNIPSLNNPPSLIFMSVCNSENDDNNLVNSIVSSGVSTVISGVGSVNDRSYLSFISHFYSNLLNKESRLNTADAYYFAIIDNSDSEHVFLRYRFNGIPCYL